MGNIYYIFNVLFMNRQHALIYFRVDWGNHIGFGHVRRCAVLADKFGRYGCQTYFAMRGHLGSSSWHPPKPTFSLGEGVLEETVGGLPYHQWLGVSQERDFQDLMECFSGTGVPDLIVIDHYGIDWEYEDRLQKLGVKVMVIDDFLHRRHACDFLLCQSILNDASSFSSRVTGDCTFFLGLDYILIRPEIRAIKERASVRSGSVNRILLNLGSADWKDYFRILNVLSDDFFSHLYVTAVIGDKCLEMPEFSKFARFNHLELLGTTSKLEELMVRSDLAIGAAGVNLWERCILGLPSIIVSVADNQVDSAIAAHDLGLAHYLGIAGEITLEDWNCCLRTLLSDERKWHSMSRKNFGFLDGRGSERICAAIARKMPIADCTNL